MFLVELLCKENKCFAFLFSRAHLALKAYQELLCTLDFMSKSGNEKIQESAKVIQSEYFTLWCAAKIDIRTEMQKIPWIWIR